MKQPDSRAKKPLDACQSREPSADVLHQLWLIYSHLKEAESDPNLRLKLLEHSREQLARVLNEMNRQSANCHAPTLQELKSPRSQAANLNCRHRQKDLTPDR